MSNIQVIQEQSAPSDVKPFYDALKKKLGRIPNIFLNMGNSPAVLKGYVGLSEAASQTSFSPMLREQIALIVGQVNGCDYCLSAHSLMGKAAGLTDADIVQARKGHGKTSKEEAILQFAKLIVEKKAHISKDDLEALKAAGVTDKEITEIVLLVSFNIFTNYFNHITDPKIDFPEVAKTV